MKQSRKVKNLNRDNCSSSKTVPQWVRVNEAHAAFTASVNGICLPMTASFQDRSTSAVSWSWRFNDGDTSTQSSPTHVFSDYVYRPIELAIVDVNGCRDTATRVPFAPLVADFTADDRTGCIPHTVSFRNGSIMASSYLWDFGDGTAGTGVTATHKYTVAGTFATTLRVISNTGQSATASRTITVTGSLPAGSVNFTISPTSAATSRSS